MHRLDYASLHPDALTAGLLSAQNNQLYDVPGRARSPYQRQVLFAAAPAYQFSPTGDAADNQLAARR